MMNDGGALAKVFTTELSKRVTDTKLRSSISLILVETDCGIPRITLEGTRGDWEEVLTREDRLQEYGNESAVTNIAGWISAFYPFDSEGNSVRQSNERATYPPCYATVDIKFRDDDTIWDIRMVAGVVGSVTGVNDTVSPHVPGSKAHEAWLAELQKKWGGVKPDVDE
ncbi:hypothetical protein BKA62DRAFT_737645 [Auriculariales sp. MPI-PUGE-AT-0066]|nr:hypothetical protein BKA62DRAFT_737645 [Auriculariales sp. MPI-PUGE-AT-0066]